MPGLPSEPLCRLPCLWKKVPEAGQLQLNDMEPVIAVSMNESIEMLTRAIVSLDHKCIQGIQANEQTCYDNVMRSIGIVTLLDPILGHAQCDEIGKQCIAENKTVPQVVLERELLTQQQLDEIFSFSNLVSEVISQNEPLSRVSYSDAFVFNIYYIYKKVVHSMHHLFLIKIKLNTPYACVKIRSISKSMYRNVA